MEKQDDICSKHCIHNDVVEKVSGSLPDDMTLNKLTNFFKIFGDQSRLKLINALLLSEMCVCDLAAISGLDQSSVSHQLRILRQANVAKYRKSGKIAYYSLSDDHVREILEKGLVHVNE